MSTQTPDFGSSALALGLLQIPHAAPVYPPVPPASHGVSIATVTLEPLRGLKLIIPPWSLMGLGDSYRVTLNTTTTVANGFIARIEEVNKDVTTYIPDGVLLDGAYELRYHVTRLGTDPESSPKSDLYVKVKDAPPGGPDQNGDVPGHSALKLTVPSRYLPPGAVEKDDAAGGVPITIHRYPIMREGDRCRISWGGKFLWHTVTALQADRPDENPIEIVVDEDTIRAAGDTDEHGLVLIFTVYDVVDNQSDGWSADLRIIVDTDNSRLIAPLIKEVVDLILDVDKLGDKDLTFQIITLDTAIFEVGDKVEIRLTGVSADNQYVDKTYTPETITSVGGVFEFQRPSTEARSLAGGVYASVTYRLIKADGSPDQFSKVFSPQVIGRARPLLAPLALDEVADTLDPDLSNTTVEIPWDISMKEGDVIQLMWDGLKADGTPYAPVLPLRPVSKSEAEGMLAIHVGVQGLHLKAIEDGTLDLYYLLLSDGKFRGPLEHESLHTVLSIGQPLAELPVPLVEGEDDGVLDPLDTPNGTHLIVRRYAGQIARDVVHILWSGSRTGQYRDRITLNSITDKLDVPFHIRAELIEGNRDGTVKALYWIKRVDGRTSPSEVLLMNIAARAPQAVIIGGRSQAGPHYYANASLLSAVSSATDEITWTYEHETVGTVGKTFLDVDPHRALTVTQGAFRRTLRASNVAGVFNILSGHGACVIKDNGSLFGWSTNAELLPPPTLTDVKFLVGGSYAYAAMKRDGTVKAWGALAKGGFIPPAIEAELKNIDRIAASSSAFVALRNDGKLFAWGDPQTGGIIPAGLAPQLNQVVYAIGSTTDFSVILRDGRVFSWGETWPEGQQITAAQGAVQIMATNRAFAAIKANGDVEAWGSAEHGGTLVTGLKDVTQLASTSAAFSALKKDGSVFSWGNARFGGTAPVGLQGVTYVTGATTAFCALKGDGQLQGWGLAEEGAQIPASVTDVLSLSTRYASFCAIQHDQTAISWGADPAIPSATSVVATYGAGKNFVLLTADKKAHAWGPGAPDLAALEGDISHID